MKKTICFFFLLFFIANSLYAYDWKSLHEKADRERLEDALSIINKGRGSAENFYILGLIYLNGHEDLEAGRVFEEALKMDKDMLGAKWGVAEVARRRHNLAKAEKALNEILSIDPKFPPACISMAYIKYMNMEFEDSVRLALRVIEAGQRKVDLSNYVRALSMYAGAKGMIAHYGGIISKAVNGTAVKPNLEKAERLDPNAPSVLFGLGSYYFLAPRIAGGDKAKAEVYLVRAIKADPKLADAYVRLAQLYRVKGSKEKYNYYMNEAIKLDPQNELILDSRSGKCRFICAGGEEN